MRTWRSGRSDSSIVNTLPLFMLPENARLAVPTGLCGHCPGSEHRRSRDNVGRVRIENQLDSILQHQLSSLEPRNLQLIARGFREQRADLCIQVPVLGPKLIEAADGIVIVHVVPSLLQLGERRNLRCCSRPLARPARPIVRWVKTKVAIRGLLRSGDALLK